MVFELSAYITVLGFNCFLVSLSRELRFLFFIFSFSFGIITKNLCLEFSLSGVICVLKAYALILDFFPYKAQGGLISFKG